MTKTEAYFDDLYDRNPDPWRLASRWYEARKRAITVASLPHARYRSALEIGCSIGELTALIAERSDAVTALDISETAVAQARERTCALVNVQVEHRDATADFPDDSFDLIVVSEVAYYWDQDVLGAMVETMLSHLEAGGDLLACHWRHPVADYPLSGDTVHATLRANLALPPIVVHKEEDFVLEVFSTNVNSVARREGLLG